MDEIKTTSVPAQQTTITKPSSMVTPPSLDAPPFLIRKSPIIILGVSAISVLVSFGALLVIYLLIVALGVIDHWTSTDIFILSLLALVVGAITFLKSNTKVYYVLSKDKLSFIAKKAVTKEKDFALNQIRSVELRQDFWAKLFGYGTLEVTFFPEKTKIQLINIAQPHMVKQAIEERGIKP